MLLFNRDRCVQLQVENPSALVPGHVYLFALDQKMEYLGRGWWLLLEVVDFAPPTVTDEEQGWIDEHMAEGQPWEDTQPWEEPEQVSDNHGPKR